MIPECEKLTWKQVREMIAKYHEDNDIHYCSDRKEHPYLTFRVVFDPFASNWPKYEQKWNYDGDTPTQEDDLEKPKTYSEESCTYEFDDGQKYWFGDIGGNSLFARCLNKNEPDHMGIRLDYYLGDWKILYCYQVKQNNDTKDNT